VIGKIMATAFGYLVTSTVISIAVVFTCPSREWTLLIAILASLFACGVERIVDAIREAKAT
jgi:hypothetical protein